MEIKNENKLEEETKSPYRTSRLSISSNSRKSPKKKKNEEKIKKKTAEEHIIEVLKKEKHQRTKLEIKYITNLLSEKIDYFKKLKDDDQISKSEKIVSVLNLEKFNPNQYIMKFGEEGDKFYIVLKGKVALYKPIYNRKEMTLQKYSNLMYDIKYHELDQLKYDRMIEKNNHLIIDVEILFKLDSNAQSMKQKSFFFIEEDQQLGIFSDGFPFGEIALMKNCTRNASVKALDETYCISLTKSDYNKIIRELEQKRLEKSLNMFKRDYPLFENWPNNLMLKIFNCISKLELTKGDYLYKQNQDCDFIYLINNGTFELYSMISYGWVQSFYSYIINAKDNIVKKILENNKKKDTELRHLYDEILANAEKSPCHFNPYKNRKIIISHSKELSLVDIKNEEEKILNNNKLFKARIRTINYKDIVGIEDSLECKKRFYFVKCVSEKGEVQKISVFDFIKILNSNDKNIKNSLLDYIAEKKNFVYKQIFNSLKSTSHRVENNINYNYDKYLSEYGNDFLSDSDIRNEIPQNIKKHLLYQLKSNSHTELFNENRSRNKAFITTNKQESLPSLNFKYFNSNSRRDKELILPEKKYYHTRNHLSISNKTSTLNQYHNLSKNVHFDNKNVYSTINYNGSSTNINVTIPTNKPLNRNDLSTLISCKKEINKSPFRSSPINSIKIFGELSPNSSYLKNVDAFPKKLKYIENKSTEKKNIKLNPFISTTLFSDISQDKMIKNKSERYLNFRDTMRSKHLFLNKNFQNILSDENGKSLKKPKYKSGIFTNLKIMVNSKI